MKMRISGLRRTFSAGMLSDLIRSKTESLANEINSFSEQRMLESDIEELVDYLKTKYKIEPFILDNSDPVFDYMEGTREIKDYGSHITQKYFRCWLDVPFTGDIDLILFEPNSFLSHSITLDVIKDAFLRFSQSVESLDDPNLQSRFNNDINTTIENTRRSNSQVGKYNESLENFSRQRLEHRREHFKKATTAAASLPYRIRQRDDAASTLTVPVRRIKIIPELPSLPNRTGPPESSLSLAMYRGILKAVAKFSLTVERSPSAFLNQDEEAIRFQLLAALNTTFEADGTGETFNFNGKTDILLRADGRNIFIAECKFWRGEKVYLDTIDQLLNYLSWRDTKSAVIIFSKNKDFSNVLSAIQQSTPTHSNYVSEIDTKEETRFDYIFSQKTDQNRRIYLSTLAFNIPVE
jgi:hypothetical protein